MNIKITGNPSRVLNMYYGLYDSETAKFYQ